MTITLSSKARKFVSDRIKSGRYSTPEEVVLAGLASLRRDEEIGDFAPGELERLIADGELSIRREWTVDAGDIFAALRERARAARSRAGRNGGSAIRGRRK